MVMGFFKTRVFLDYPRSSRSPQRSDITEAWGDAVYGVRYGIVCVGAACWGRSVTPSDACMVCDVVVV